MEIKEYLIALNMIGNLGVKKLRRLLDEFLEPEKIFKAPLSRLMRIPGIGESTAEGIKNILNSREFKQELKVIEKEKIDIKTILDEDYPVNLKNIYDPPIVLYIKGKILLKDAIAVALVGSRRASKRGCKIAYRLAKELAYSEMTVVSGLARGIDSASHKGALDAGGRTIAVIGSGLKVVYPPENEDLFNRIAESSAVISEFPLYLPPNRQNFPRRNRIISGLSLGVVVVEAGRDSGSLITANFALDEGREVFAVPQSPGFYNSEGTNQLIKRGAKLVESIDDIIDELNPQIKEYITVNKDRELRSGSELKPFDFEKIERDVYELLSDKPQRLEELSEKSNYTRQDVAASLFSLEIKGMTKKVSGNLFIKSKLGDKI